MAFFPAARPSSNRLRRRREDGYVLLYLLLMVALMGIVALAVLVPIKFQLQRDREQELIHRGVQYSRAIRNYYKKFGRYPTRLEDLDNTNNLRYLRKHYKDPVTGKDFKLLHYGDPGVSLTGSVGSTPIAGANTVGQMNASGSGNSAFGGSSSSFSQSSGFGGSSNSGFGSGSNSSFGNSSSGGFGSGFGNSNSSGTSNSGGSSGSGTNQTAGTNSSPSGTGTTPDSSSTQSGSSGQGNNQVFGGGPIVGVASASKDSTIREFNHKHKYNEWQFVYDPTTDRGGLILTPNQPPLQIANQPLNGQPGNSNTNGSSFGQPTGFGNNNSGLMGGPTTPQPPPSSSSPPQ
jgi:type II secretory pathway pseudopilin PulG